MPATEILIVTVGARNIIRNAKTEQLNTLLQTNHELGMQTMDKSLKSLYQQGLISYEDAISRCKFADTFEAI